MLSTRVPDIMDLIDMIAEQHTKQKQLAAQLASALNELRDHYVPNDSSRPEVAAADEALERYRKASL